MMKGYIHKVGVALAALLITLPAWSAKITSFADLEWVTEAEFPPYNYTVKGSKEIKGISIDMLMAAAKKVNLAVDKDKFKVWPWARAYDVALKGPNIMLFATTRTEQREPLFKWAGPIIGTKVVLMAKKSSNIKINGVDDMLKHSIGGVAEDVGMQLAMTAGVPKLKLAKPDANAKKLADGKIDLWAYEENSARWLLKANGFQSSDFEAVYVFKESAVYYAFSKDIPDEIVEGMQKAIDAVKADKALHDSILDAYR